MKNKRHTPLSLCLSEAMSEAEAQNPFMPFSYLLLSFGVVIAWSCAN
jgi:hypothetical protein